MKSEIPSIASPCACAQSPIVAALSAAFFQQTTSLANFQDEIDFRIRQAKNTAAFLAFTFDHGALHRIDFLSEHLHGITSLLLNELIIIECLHNTLHEVLAQGLKGEAQL